MSALAVTMMAVQVVVRRAQEESSERLTATMCALTSLSSLCSVVLCLCLLCCVHVWCACSGHGVLSTQEGWRGLNHGAVLSHHHGSDAGTT